MAKLIRRKALGGVIAAALFAAASTYAGTPADINGSAMPEGYAYFDRTVEVTPATRSINVAYGETVRFLVQGAGEAREVIWKFDGTADKLTLGTLLATPSASEGSSQMAAPGSDVTVYVHQGNNPMRTPRGAGAF